MAGAQWSATFTLRDDDGQPMNITGKTFEFAIRPSATDAAVPALVAVAATATSQGYITADTTTAVVQVVLTATATASLGTGCRPFALWMDPGLPTQICLVEGAFYSRLASSP
ncbi:hypothetical protein ACIA6C_28135 [Streptomyces sp. NPDC051578]|uniref:hypothetical protein n=1 Tax=Streptomyces sp. NPDC051578 TaxID=3365662 RepID=UPI003795FA2D